MPSLDFPSNPVDGQTYSAGGVNYVYNSGIGAWLTSYLSTPLATSSNTQVLFNDSGASNGSFGLTFDRRANTLTSNTVIVNSNLGIGPISDFSSTGKNAKLAIDTGGINIDDGYFVAWGGGTGRTSITGNKANGTMVLAATGNSSGYMGFSVNNSERMRIDANGNVGIGTGSPSKKAEVADISSSTTLTAGLMISNYSGTTDTRAGIVFKSYDNIGCSIWSRRTGNYSGDLCFGTKPDSYGSVIEDGIVERMRIDGLGRITMPYQPMFQAFGGSTQSFSGSQSTVVIQLPSQTTLGSRTSSYNTSTYRFTAPISGTYMFMGFHASTNAATGPESIFCVNGSGVAYGGIYYTGAYQTTTSFVLLQLSSGDFVDFRMTNNNSTSFTIDTSRTRFAGWLIG